jgi:hypothetical protein
VTTPDLTPEQRETLRVQIARALLAADEENVGYAPELRTDWEHETQNLRDDWLRQADAVMPVLLTEFADADRQGAERVAAVAVTAEALHEQHRAEFPWMREDGFTTTECGNCQRWAKYARAALTEATPTERTD